MLSEFIHEADATTGIIVVLVAGGVGYGAKKVTDWTRRSRQRDLTDVVLAAIANAPDVLRLLAGQQNMQAQQVDTSKKVESMRVELRVLRGENSDQHEAMRRRMDRLAEAHSDTRQRVSEVEKQTNQIDQRLGAVEKEQQT